MGVTEIQVRRNRCDRKRVSNKWVWHNDSFKQSCVRAGGAFRGSFRGPSATFRTHEGHAKRAKASANLPRTFRQPSAARIFATSGLAPPLRLTRCERG